MALPAPTTNVVPLPKPTRAAKRKAASGAPPPVDVSDAKPIPRAEGEKRDDAPPPPERAGETVPPDCPIVPLAREDAIYHFLTRAGEILSFSAKDLGDANISALFDGDTEWLRIVFPDWGKRDRTEIAEAEKDGKARAGIPDARRARLADPRVRGRRHGAIRARTCAAWVPGVHATAT